MSSIDLVILGMVMEKPQSAYAIQKDVEYHHLSRWTKISVPSVYKKVLQLKEKGYLCSQPVPGERFAEKAVYSITESGKAYFLQLMEDYAARQIPLQFDCNVVIANLNKVDTQQARRLLEKLRDSLLFSARALEGCANEYADIPFTGRTIFEQQGLLYQALLQWLDTFEAQLTAQADV